VEYYAHSGKSDINITCQLYKEHVQNVMSIASLNAKRCLKHSTLNKDEQKFFLEVVEVSSYYHDIGKLDENIQNVLKSDDYSDEKTK